MFRLIFYVQQLRPYSRRVSEDDTFVTAIAWRNVARKHVATTALLPPPLIKRQRFTRCAHSRGRTRGFAYTRRNKRGTETDYYAVKFYALYSVFLMRDQHAGRGSLIDPDL